MIVTLTALITIAMMGMMIVTLTAFITIAVMGMTTMVMATPHSCSSLLQIRAGRGYSSC
jgi:hypothetical protein